MSRLRAMRSWLAVVVAPVLGVVVALALIPLGAYESMACAVVTCGVKKKPPLPEPEKEWLDPVEVAVRGGYVALGDSYSSGEGAFNATTDGSYTDGATLQCRRSRGSYFSLVESAFAFRRGGTFWACSGATTRNVLSRGMYGDAAQINRVGSTTSLVTLSIGGNNIGFTEILRNCIIRLPWSSSCTEQQGTVRRRVAATKVEVGKVIAAIEQRAPQARILLIGYPRLFPVNPSETHDNISVDDQKWLNRMAREFSSTLGAVARQADQAIAARGGKGSVEFVEAYDAFNGHEAGTAEPYVHGVGLDLTSTTVKGKSYHPTDTGYKRLGELIRRQVPKGPGRQIQQYRTGGILDRL